MSKPIYIVGAGGHTRSLMNIIDEHKFEVKGILDKTYKPTRRELINGIPLIDNIENLTQYSNLVLGIGDLNERADLYCRFEQEILNENLIHKTSCIEQHVEIGTSNQFFGFSYINSNSSVGNNNIINTRAIVEHENTIGSNNHISIGVILGGRVRIGNGCFIGAGTTVIDKITICDNVTIGANAVVVRDIKEPGTYVGNPAKKIK